MASSNRIFSQPREANEPGSSARARAQDSSELPFDLKNERMRQSELETNPGNSPRTFGAIIVTRPHFDQHRLNHFRVYTINPGIIKSWLGPSGSRRLNECVPTCEPPADDIRLLYNVNEVRIRLTPQRQKNSSRGGADLVWTEAGSGNEILISSDLWASVP